MLQIITLKQVINRICKSSNHYVVDMLCIWSSDDPKHIISNLNDWWWMIIYCYRWDKQLALGIHSSSKLCAWWWLMLVHSCMCSVSHFDLKLHNLNPVLLLEMSKNQLGCHQPRYLIMLYIQFMLTCSLSRPIICTLKDFSSLF